MSNTYELLWEEDFSYTNNNKPRSDWWNFQRGDGTDFGIPGWGNQELQYYLEEAAYADGDFGLTITASRNQNDLNTYYGNALWTSSRLATDNKVHFKYGRIEILATIPEGKGTWPALWMLGSNIKEVPWPHCGEIDIMEARGINPNELIGTVHGPTYFADHGKGASIFLDEPLSANEHEFAIEWLPSGITWFLDGEEYFSVSPESIAPEVWVFDNYFYFLTNLAIGGGFAGEVDPKLSTRKFNVRYIRHYSINGIGENVLVNDK